MNKSHPSHQLLTRRQFTIIGLCAGGLAVTAAGIVTGLSRRRGNSTVVFRNPAYRKRQDSSGPLIECRKETGEIIAYRMDRPAATFWDKVPTAEVFAAGGKKVTIEEVIDTIAPEFNGQAASRWQRDARAFAEEAIRHGVFLTEGARVRVAYTPPLNR